MSGAKANVRAHRRKSRRRRDAIGIVGVGLIGGSLAKAIRLRFPRKILIGVEPRRAPRAAAQRDRLFDFLSPRPSSDLEQCEIVILAAPVAQVVQLLGTVSSRMRDGAILSDVAGVKEPVIHAARSRVRPGVAFVGAHPMFGGPSGGYGASRPDSWRGGVVAVCTDGADRHAVARIARFHRVLGARVLLCTAVDHDQAIAAVSQLPYVLASAIALTARDAGRTARRLAARGLAGTTRLAAFEYGVQGETSRRNRHLGKAVRSFAANLRRLLDALAASPSAARAAFDRARRAQRQISSRKASRR
ncbi:MAG TPA: prephenate dehydrogenase [Thermoanaerobaculia bacterium]